MKAVGKMFDSEYQNSVSLPSEIATHLPSTKQETDDVKSYLK